MVILKYVIYDFSEQGVGKMADSNDNTQICLLAFSFLSIIMDSRIFRCSLCINELQSAIYF